MLCSVIIYAGVIFDSAVLFVPSVIFIKMAMLSLGIASVPATLFAFFAAMVACFMTCQLLTLPIAFNNLRLDFKQGKFTLKERTPHILGLLILALITALLSQARDTKQ